jgi:hypothetical protein
VVNVFDTTKPAVEMNAVSEVEAVGESRATIMAVKFIGAARKDGH